MGGSRFKNGAAGVEKGEERTAYTLPERTECMLLIWFAYAICTMVSVAFGIRLAFSARVTVSDERTPRNSSSPAARVAINPAETLILFSVKGRMESSCAVGTEPPLGSISAILALAFAPEAGVIE